MGIPLRQILITLMCVAAITATATKPGEARDEDAVEHAPEAVAEYATDPLRESPLDPAKVPVEFVGLNNWLNGNAQRLDAEQTQYIRETLFSLIDWEVKQLFARNGSIVAASDNDFLERLFFWADQLGVYGAADARDTVATDPGAIPARTAVPPTFGLSLERGYFTLSSHTADWRVSFPYHFMVWRLQEFVSNAGAPTQIATVSTGFGHHQGRPGFSQATLMILSSQSQSLAAFEDFWRPRGGIPPTAAARPIEIAGFSAYKGFDDATRIHTEIVFFEGRTGPVAVFYMGVDGTYQWNRPHFLDFLRSMTAPSA